MGYQKRSYGERYYSSSGHAFIIGGISKGVIAMVLYPKAYKQCDDVDKKVGEAKQHEYPNNFERRYKFMEAESIMNMVEDAFQYRCSVKQ